MSKKLKPIPKFKSEDEERDFWANHSALDYFDVDNAIINPVFPKLKPSSKTISLRLPESLLDRIKQEANKRDLPYQSYLKSKLYDLFQKPSIDTASR